LAGLVMEVQDFKSDCLTSMLNITLQPRFVFIV
jgi:hypothetical protein